MDKLTKYIDCYVPVTACNLKCDYCYITQNKRWSLGPFKFNYSAEQIRKALSKERLGGTCLINLCGGGETLIPHETLEIMKELLEEGHYLMVVTNGTLTNRFDEIIKWGQKYLERLFFKFSFHYKELVKNDKLNLFFENVRKVKKAGCSITLELVPTDDLIPEIDNIKRVCKEQAGAWCHITLCRCDEQFDKPLLTQYSFEEYYDIWKVFDSKLFDFKMKMFNVKVSDFCYAGQYSYLLNLETGKLSQCPKLKSVQSIFDNLCEPLTCDVVGCNCSMPYCYNSHIFMGIGIIPDIKAPNYEELRNRKCEDGTEWIHGKFKEFISQKIEI